MVQAHFYLPRQSQNKIAAFADVTLSEGLTIRGFRIVNGVNGLFAAVPSRAVTVEGKLRFWNQVQFVSNEVKSRFLSELLDHYGRWREAGEQMPSADVSSPSTNP